MPFIVSCRKEYARYIPGRCLLLDSTVMLTPKINSGMHTNPYDSHLRQGLTKPIIHRLCLSFLYIDSLLQERQQTLAAHKDSPPLSPTRTTSCDRGRTFYRQKGSFFSASRFGVTCACLGYYKQPIDHWIPIGKKGTEK